MFIPYINIFSWITILKSEEIDYIDIFGGQYFKVFGINRNSLSVLIECRFKIRTQQKLSMQNV